MSEEKEYSLPQATGSDPQTAATERVINGLHELTVDVSVPICWRQV